MTTGIRKFAFFSIPERSVITIGLLTYVVLGMAGSAFDRGSSAQNILYAVSGVGLVAAGVVAAMHLVRRNHTIVASGFVILAIAEAMLIVGGVPSAATDYLASFAGGVMYYIPGLLLISLPSVMPLVVRALGVLAAAPWAVFAFQNLTGKAPAFDAPVTVVGYILLSLAVIGWAISLARPEEAETSR
ncbi:MAG: hypothetical protein HYY01_12715 [Chloroflexi bacterium]|nr:hypothetical protein [Chloroflexota bacterium]